MLRYMLPQSNFVLIVLTSMLKRSLFIVVVSVGVFIKIDLACFAVHENSMIYCRVVVSCLVQNNLV